MESQPTHVAASRSSVFGDKEIIKVSLRAAPCLIISSQAEHQERTTAHQKWGFDEHT